MTFGDVETQDDVEPWPGLDPIEGRIPRGLKIRRREKRVFIIEKRTDAWRLLPLVSVIPVVISLGIYFTDTRAPDAVSASLTAYAWLQAIILGVFCLSVIPRYRRLEYHRENNTYCLRNCYFKLAREGKIWRGDAVILICDYAEQVTEDTDLTPKEKIIQALSLLTPLEPLASFLIEENSKNKIFKRVGVVPALIAAPYQPDGKLIERGAELLLPCRSRADAQAAVRAIEQCQSTTV